MKPMNEPSFEQMKQCLVDRYKHERLYGDRGEYGQGVVYGDCVVRAHLADLIKYGYDSISKYESRTGEAVYFHFVNGVFVEIDFKTAMALNRTVRETAETR